MNFESLIKARKALEQLWQEAMLKGRCWGPKKECNSYKGSNITLAIGNELITISQLPDGKLAIHEFVEGNDTLLGKRVKEIFDKEGIPFERGRD